MNCFLYLNALSCTPWLIDRDRMENDLPIEARLPPRVRGNSQASAWRYARHARVPSRLNEST